MIDGLKTFDLWEQGLGIPPTLPSFYWNVYSYEQRIKEICLRLERMLEYQDVQTDKINECVDQVNELTKEVEALTKEVARINQALLDEISAREAGDQKLETELQQEINDRIKAVNDEATTRQAQVDKLTADLEAEAKTRQEQVDKLTADLETEATTRETADTTLQGNIDKVAGDLADETTARETADTTLQTNIDKVASDTTALDTRVTQNTQQIADEVTARTNLSNSLTEALTNEQTVRENKDKELDQQIADLTADLPSVESDNLFTSSTKVPTVDAIRASSNQAISSTNKLATMADIGGGGGGGGTTVNSIAPLTVSTAPTADGKQSIAIGENANAHALYSIATGREAYVDGKCDNGIAIGEGASVKTSEDSAVGSIAIGSEATTDGTSLIALGMLANANGTDSIAIGSYANTPSGSNSDIAIGRAATATNGIAIGSGAQADYSITIGEQASTYGAGMSGGVYIGKNSTDSGLQLVLAPYDEYDRGNQWRGRIGKGYVDSSVDGDQLAVGFYTTSGTSRLTVIHGVTNDLSAAGADAQACSVRQAKDFCYKGSYIGDPETHNLDATSTTLDMTQIVNQPTMYECTFTGNVPAGTVGDAYGFNIFDGSTIIGTVSGFKGSEAQQGAPLIGNVILMGNKSYGIGQEGLTSITIRQMTKPDYRTD